MVSANISDSGLRFIKPVNISAIEGVYKELGKYISE